MDQRFDRMDGRLDATEAQVAEARQYFGVPADNLYRQVARLAKGVVTVNERVDRFQTEVAREFAEVKTLIRDGYVALDRRVRRLEGQRRRRPK